MLWIKNFAAANSVGIAYDTVIASPYTNSQQGLSGKFKIQYRDGKDSTVGCGNEKRAICAKETTPHSKSGMMILLGLAK